MSSLPSSSPSKGEVPRSGGGDPSTRNLVPVGIITGAHGIRGEVKLKSFTEIPAAIIAYGPLHTAAHGKIEVEKLREQKDGFIAVLKNVGDRTAAEALRGVELFVRREHLPEPGDGQFYLIDLVGKSVETNGSTLGKIAGFQNFGAGELMELDSGLLIPAALIISVAEAVSVSLPEGFLELNDNPPPLSPK